MPESWYDVPIVEIPPPPLVCCPRCGMAGGYIIVRSMGDQGDGSVTRRCVCKAEGCLRRFLVVVNPELCQ